MNMLLEAETLFNKARELMPNYQVLHVMSPCDVIALDEFASVAEAIQLFDEKEISAVPIKDNIGRYKGVFSKTDIARQKLVEGVERTGSLKSLRLKDYMNPNPPRTILKTATIKEAAQVMTRYEVHRLFVEDAEGVLCGVISATNVLKMLTVTPTEQ